MYSNHIKQIVDNIYEFYVSKSRRNPLIDSTSHLFSISQSIAFSYRRRRTQHFQAVHGVKVIHAFSKKISSSTSNFVPISPLCQFCESIRHFRVHSEHRPTPRRHRSHKSHLHKDRHSLDLAIATQLALHQVRLARVLPSHVIGSNRPPSFL
jgi:hypothetical protein